MIAGIGGVKIATAPKDGLPQILDQPDLVLPPHDLGGTLRVTALNAGAPMPGVSVKLALRDFESTFSPGWAAGLMPDKLVAILTPSATTNAQGKAIFENLTPGLYCVTARLAKEDHPQGDDFGLYEDARRTSQVDHVPVVAGQLRDFHVSVSRSDVFPVPFRVEHSDGSLLAKTSVATSQFKPVIESGWSSGVAIDAKGVGNFRIEQKGLFHVSVAYLTPSLGVKSIPFRLSPSYAGERLIAVSQLAPRKMTLPIRTHLVAPATITAFVEDENGRPAMGVVLVDAEKYDRSFDNDTRSATVGHDGSVRFERVQAGIHKLKALVPGWTPAHATLDADDAVLQGQFAVPSRQVSVSPGEVTTERLRRQRVSYIRGKITPVPPPYESWQFDLLDNWTTRPLESQCLWSQKTGEYIIGPVLPGEYKIGLTWDVENATELPIEHTVNVMNAGVHHEDIPYAPHEAPKSADEPTTVEGTVFDADRKTPVYAARVSVWLPGSDEPQSLAWTDARGRFTLHSPTLQKRAERVDADSGEEAEEPVLIAWLPGQLGGRSRRSSKDLRMTLPQVYRSPCPRRRLFAARSLSAATPRFDCPRPSASSPNTGEKTSSTAS